MNAQLSQQRSTILGYDIFGEHITYYTANCLVGCCFSDSVIKTMATVNGTEIAAIRQCSNNYLAILYINQRLQVRLLNDLQSVLRCWNQVSSAVTGEIPIIQGNCDQIYLAYHDSLQIFDLGSSQRRGYTDILLQYPQESIRGIIVSDIIDQAKTVILQLKNRLIFTILPIPITEILLPQINQVLSLMHPSIFSASKREYIIVLHLNCLLRVYNLVSLKQIAEIKLEPFLHERVQLCKDEYCEWVLVRYLDADKTITRNKLLRVNIKYYYTETRYPFGEQEPFFDYCVDLDKGKYYWLMKSRGAVHANKHCHQVDLCYIEAGIWKMRKRVVSVSHKQPMECFGCRMHDPSWETVEEWRQFIVGFMELNGMTIITADKEGEVDIERQERPIKDLDKVHKSIGELILRFAKTIEAEGPLQQEKLQQQWNCLLFKYVIDRRYLIDHKMYDMKPCQQGELPKWVGPFNIDERQDEQHVIPASKAKLQKNLQTTSSNVTNIAQNPKKVECQYDAAKEQEQYQKMVQQFLSQKEQKEAELNVKSSSLSSDQKMQLLMPILSQEERRFIIHIANEDTLDTTKTTGNIPMNALNVNQNLQNLDECEESPKTWKEKELVKEVGHQMHQQFQPLKGKLATLVTRMQSLDNKGIQILRRCEDKLQTEQREGLPATIDRGCRKMFSAINQSISQRVSEYRQKIIAIETVSTSYRQQLIQQLKMFILFQVKNRIGLFYRSRKELEPHVLALTRLDTK